MVSYNEQYFCLLHICCKKKFGFKFWTCQIRGTFRHLIFRLIRLLRKTEYASVLDFFFFFNISLIILSCAYFLFPFLFFLFLYSFLFFVIPFPLFSFFLHSSFSFSLCQKRYSRNTLRVARDAGLYVLPCQYEFRCHFAMNLVEEDDIPLCLLSPTSLTETQQIRFVCWEQLCFVCLFLLFKQFAGIGKLHMYNRTSSPLQSAFIAITYSVLNLIYLFCCRFILCHLIFFPSLGVWVIGRNTIWLVRKSG